jgi:hypothetical protein
MRFFGEPIEFDKQAGIGSPVWRGRAESGAALQAFAVAAHRSGGRLAALWGEDRRSDGEGFRLHAAFGLDMGHAWLGLDLPADNPTYPDLAGIFPAANRMQRATRDLVGIAHEGGDRMAEMRAPGCATAPGRRTGSRCATIRARAGNFPTRRATTTSSRSAGRAPTRFPSARSTPASSSRATSASR